MFSSLVDRRGCKLPGCLFSAQVVGSGPDPRALPGMVDASGGLGRINKEGGRVGRRGASGDGACATCKLAERIRTRGTKLRKWESDDKTLDVFLRCRIQNMSMYVRVKRQKRTIFLSCESFPALSFDFSHSSCLHAGEPSDTFSKLKAKVAGIVSTAVSSSNDEINCEDSKVGLLHGNRVMTDTAAMQTLRDLKVEDGAVLALVYSDASKDGGWESIDIIEPTPELLQESESLENTR
eukprot:752369-Hanusia_phi.AAC.1